MTFEPLLPPVILLLAGAIAVIALVAAYRQPTVPAFLRLAAVLLLAVMIANPVRVHQATHVDPPPVALVVDASASMQRADASEGTPRLARANHLAGLLAAELESDFGIERAILRSEVLSGTSDSASGDTSYADLATLGQRSRPPTAVILLSDGIERGAADPDQRLADAGIPVSTVGLGDRRSPANVSVTLAVPSPTVFPDQFPELRAHLDVSPDCIGRRAEVTWLQIDPTASDQAEVLSRSETTLRDDQVLTHSVAVGSAVGQRCWQVRIAPFPDEVASSDNQASAVAQVVDRPVRILVLEGQPWWDTAFAIRAWRRDRQFDVVSRLRVGDHVHLAAADSASEKAEGFDLAETDVVVLGRHIEQLLDDDQQDTLAQWVRDGGGMLMLGSGERESGSLADLDPARWHHGHQQVRPRAAPAGMSLALMPADAQEAPAVQAGRIQTLRPRSTILLDGAEPVVVQRRVGAGQVVLVNGEGWWRWRLQGRTPMAERFWQQLVKNLVPSLQAPLQADRPRYRAGQTAVVGVSIPEADAVEAIAPDGASQRVPVQDGTALLPLPDAGLWGLRHIDGAGTITGTTLVVDSDVREVVDTGRRDARMLRLATTTGGQHIDGDRADAEDQMRALAAGLSRRAALRAPQDSSEPLITGGWWLLAVAICLALEWLWRRRVHGVV